MENEIQEKIIEEEEKGPMVEKPQKDYSLPMSMFVSAVIIAGAWVYTARLDAGIVVREPSASAVVQGIQVSTLEEAVLPTEGVVLPVSWGNLGSQLVNTGAIDEERFRSLYETRGQFTDEYSTLLSGNSSGKLKITRENAGYLLNLFWALGLANKNQILEAGEMVDPRYGGAGGFASTGGWTMAKGNPMDHYSKHVFFTLTSQQQALIDKISRGIYRPCCGNSVHFPDCNHGMAMLGLLELMASQGATEQQMWDAALAVNSYWFPDTYMTIATYMKNRGIDWNDVNPQEMLGSAYSSSQGYANISSQVIQPEQQQYQGGSGCGVDAGGVSAPAPRQQSGCGV